MARGRIQWTAKEEAALRDGVTKYGVGKWRRILDDPELSTALILRTNVDLKDKWRYMITKGSRNGYKPVQKNFKKTSRQYKKSVALTVAQPEAPAIIHKSVEDGDSDQPTVKHQQSPQILKVANSSQLIDQMEEKATNIEETVVEMVANAVDTAVNTYHAVESTHLLEVRVIIPVKLANLGEVKEQYHRSELIFARMEKREAVELVSKPSKNDQAADESDMPPTKRRRHLRIEDIQTEIEISVCGGNAPASDMKSQSQAQTTISKLTTKSENVDEQSLKLEESTGTITLVHLRLL
ncbi:hypothetical protein POM88_039272 [Heracleum sosnowskyi]|uniref:MYB transcription factor n=1 Tax=Heracleum sosnowskyi TaxID=360622 RepID=A0AAD8HB39_9APIA|nr:hypothetical protein POM88_039272 [Heracleum sosnowskyi]